MRRYDKIFRGIKKIEGIVELISGNSRVLENPAFNLLQDEVKFLLSLDKKQSKGLQLLLREILEDVKEAK
jgi:hypothetical protein